MEKNKKCPACGSPLSDKDDINKVFKKFEAIVKSRKDAYKKKIALFNLLLKCGEFNEPEPLENKRIDYLLQSKLHAELAKKSMKEYEKLTVKDYTRAK
jgi:hypothetical protein